MSAFESPDALGLPDLTPEQVRYALRNIHKLPKAKQARTLEIIKELTDRKRAEKRRSSLLEFVKFVDKDYKVGAHHKHLAALLEDMAHGRKSRITVNIAPRFGKSQLTSIYFPAWFIGNFPNKKIMMVSHTADLAVDFGRKVRNLVASEEYKQVFPDVSLAADSKSAGRWDTNKGGTYFAVGVGGALAGRGGDLIVLDDPHNEGDILNGNFEVFDKAYDWYTYGLRTRLMPEGRIALVMTRWARNDLSGRVIQDMVRNPDGDQWEVVEFPAVLDEGTAQARSLWPEQWPLETLLRTKASMPPFQWNAQYQQNPTSAEAAIIKPDWWQKWEKDDPPTCEYIIMSLDAAAEKNNRADFTSITTWGVFYKGNEYGEEEAAIILLNAIKERMEFPELKRRTYEQYMQWEPDWLVVEKKSSGTPLYQELRAAGIPVQEYTPHRGTGDKTARMNSISDIFASGMVWYPVGRRWAEEVVEEVCGFPAMPNDDHCFTNDTKILRCDGTEIMIPYVQVGDYVQTPAGPRRVIDSRCTNPAADIVEVRLSDGRVLRGTPNHPVYSPSEGAFVALGELVAGDELCVMSNTCSTEELTTVGTLTRRALPYADTSTGSETAKTKRSIGLFMRISTALSRLGSTFITRMETRATTIQKTLSVSAPLTTEQNTATPTLAPVSCTNEAGRALTVSLNPLKHLLSSLVTSVGRALRRCRLTAQDFVVARAETTTTGSALLSVSALYVMLRSVAQHVQLSVPKTAEQSASGYVKSSDTSKDTPRELRSSTKKPAHGVVLRSRQIALTPSCVPTSAALRKSGKSYVVSTRKGSVKEPVYNLTIEDNPVYFANGVLVHNCDTTIMALLRFRNGGFLRLPTDRFDDEPFMPRRAAYY